MYEQKNDIKIKLLLIYIDIHVCLKYITTPNQGCMRHTSWRCMQIVGKWWWGNVVTVYLHKCRNTIFYLHTVKVINFGIPCRCAFVVILVTVRWWCTSRVYITGVHHRFTSQRHTILLKWVERPENVVEWEAVVARHNMRRIVTR